jgi:hypothetical protein
MAHPTIEEALRENVGFFAPITIVSIIAIAMMLGRCL